MAWYDADWESRFPVLGKDATGSEDTRITIYPAMSDFWANVDSSGDDIRVTDGGGVDLVDYELTTWSYAAKTAVVDLDAINSDYSVFWFYYNSAGASAASTTLADAIGGAGQADDETDPLVAATRRVVLVTARAPNTSAITDIFVKTSTERIMIWWDITDQLARRSVEVEGSNFLEEPSTLSYQVTTGGTPQAPMDGEPTIIQTDRGRGRIYVGTPVQAGSDGTDYTVELVINTVLGGSESTTNQTIEARCIVQVVDPDETT